ncbi:MAG: hypothetical protein Q9166_005384, partial [cf. Caloplaca sp. 2 TL-2023]
RTHIEQETLLRRPESRKILCSVRDDSSSLLWLRDDDSCGTRKSTFTETSEFLDASFTFDPEVLKSRAYLSAMRSNLKQAVRGSNQRSKQQTLPQRRSTNEFGDTATPANRGKWTLNARQAASRQCLEESSESSLGFSGLRRDQSSDTLSVSPSISPIHGSNGQLVTDPARHRLLHMPSLLRSRDSLSGSSRASTKSPSNSEKLENGRDETQILMVGNTKEAAIFLERSMILAYGHNYTKAEKSTYRSTILQILVADMKGLLLAMRNLGIPLAEESSEWHAHILEETAEEDWEIEPSVIMTAVVTLWKDPGVVEAFDRKDTCNTFEEADFFKAIQRISKPGYEPSLEDISRASISSDNVQDVLIPRKSAGKRYQYRFINNIGPDSGGNQWVYTSGDVSLLVHVVDTNAYDIMGNDDVTTNPFKQDLVFFQKVCSSRWLAETPVLVLVSNIGAMTKRLQDSPIHQYFPDFTGQPKNLSYVKSYFRNLYLHVERKYNMRVWVDFTESGANAVIGKTVVGIIDKILTEDSVLSYGLR